MTTIFSPRDPATWRASSPPSSLPERAAEVITPDAIFERTRKALDDDALSLEDARQLTADAIAAFLRIAEEEQRAHEATISLSSTEQQAEKAAAARGKHRTAMERLDVAIGRLIGEVLTSAEDRSTQAERQTRHSAAQERVKAAAKLMRQAEAAFVRAREECAAALSDARAANGNLPRGGNTIKIPDELRGEVILSVEVVEKWCQQDGKGVVTPYDDKGIDTQGGKRVGVHPMAGFVRRGMFDKITYRRLGDEKPSVRLVHRPDLKTAMVMEEELEEAKTKPPTMNREAVLDALAQGTQTYVERGRKTTLPM